MAYIQTKLQKEIVIDSIITMHYFEYMKDFVFKGEAHDFWEFLYVDKGTVSVLSGEDYFVMNAGDIIFHQPNEFHAIQSIGKTSPNLIAMSYTSHSPAMDFFVKKNYTLKKEERFLISQLITEAKNTFTTPIHIPSIEEVKMKNETPFGSQQLISNYLELFLIMVVRNHSESTLERISGPATFPEREISQSNRMRQIQQYLEFHICEQLTIPQICEATSLSRSSLQALFHDKKNCGVMEYFNNMKIQRAKDIIRGGTMNFTEIAYFLSYSSLPYFSKQFKKTTGMSPKEYASSIKGITQALKADNQKSFLPPPLKK